MKTIEQRLEAIERNLCEVNELLRHKPGNNPVLERQQIETDPKSIDMPALNPLIRDWEVLEFKSVGKWDGEEGVIYSRSEDGLYGTFTLFSQDNMLYGQNGSVKDRCWSIHSVRRTTDGQVFTVGDRIKEGVIDLFSIEGNRMGVWTEPGNEIRFRLVDQVEKSEPIYTSADGVAIFEGDTVYFWYSGYSQIDEDTAHAGDNADNHYSSRTAAETAYKNWLYDQPVLKLSDVSGDNFVALVELAKSRLV